MRSNFWLKPQGLLKLSDSSTATTALPSIGAATPEIPRERKRRNTVTNKNTKQSDLHLITPRARIYKRTRSEVIETPTPFSYAFGISLKSATAAQD